MTESDTRTEGGDVEQTPRHAILCELEYTAFDGRQITCDVLKSVLADKGAKLTPLLFSRHCLDAAPDSYLDRLLNDLGKGRLSSASIAKDMREGISLSLLDSGVSVRPSVQTLLQAALGKKISVGMLSTLDQKHAQPLAAKLGMGDNEPIVQTYSPGLEQSGGSNPWFRLARSMGFPSAACLALTSSLGTCKAALAAGMCCVVVYDAFTSFQDFGGADYVTGELGDGAISDILAITDNL